MSTQRPTVEHPLFGPAEVVDREWQPAFGRPDREVLTLDVEGIDTPVTAEAREVQE